MNTKKIIEKLKEAISRFENDEMSLYNFGLVLGRCYNKLRSEHTKTTGEDDDE